MYILMIAVLYFYTSGGAKRAIVRVKSSENLQLVRRKSREFKRRASKLRVVRMTMCQPGRAADRQWTDSITRVEHRQ